MNHVKPSLRKALQANDLLSENDLAEDWGSRYLGNPRSLALFLPKQSIKNMPSSAKVPQLGRPSVIVSRNSYTEGPSIVADSLSKKSSFISDQVKSSSKKVRYDKNLSFLPETLVSSKPEFSSKDYYLDVMENL